MNNVKKKVLLELLVVPEVIIPSMIGIGILLPFTIIAGKISIVGLAFLMWGAVITAFKLLSFKKRVAEESHRAEKKKKEDRLHDLSRRLKQLSADEDEKILQELICCYKVFSNKIHCYSEDKYIPPELIKQIDELFEQSISHIEMCLETHRTMHISTGDIKKHLIAKHARLISEVESSVEFLLKAVSDIQTLQSEKTEDGLPKLQKCLQEQMELTVKVNEELNQDRYSEYG